MNIRYVITILTGWLLSLTGLIQAQDFTVKNFRPLPNDISAYINPVRDLNDEACALIKVVAPAEFVFSSPLGIVSRHTEVGEIWLYVPHGTRMITIKHPVWGVLRDYLFPSQLESRMTYELVLEPPLSVQAQQMLSVKERHVRLAQRALSISPPSLPYDKKRRTPLQWEYFAEITASVGRNMVLPGIRAAIVKRHGFYVFGQTSFRSLPTTTARCDRHGYLPAENYTPYYNDRSRTATYLVAAGAVHRFSKRFYCYEGVGYGKHQLAWQTTDEQWVYNTDRSKKGWAAEAGVVYRLNRFCLSAGAQTVTGSLWMGQVGFGVVLK